MKVTFYGVRGSIPAPGFDTSRYGGNTTCAEVITSGDYRMIIDCGTGIRKLGLKLLKEKEPAAIPIFITHAHWDHVQGLPFFLPIYMPRFKLMFVSANDSFDRLYQTLYNQMDGYVFPADLQEVQSQVKFEIIDSKGFDFGGVHIDTIRNNHPVPTHGLRIKDGGKTFVFITDNELRAEKPVTPYQDFVAFCQGADILVHDAQYTEEDMKKTRGWGHSTFSEAIKLAEEAGVKRLGFYHHDPERTDDQLDEIIKQMQETTQVKLFGTREGEELEL